MGQPPLFAGPRQAPSVKQLCGQRAAPNATPHVRLSPLRFAWVRLSLRPLKFPLELARVSLRSLKFA